MLRRAETSGLMVGLMLIVFAGLLSADSSTQFKGTIESIGSSNLVVSGQTVLVDGSTEIEDGNESSIPFSSLKVGDTVKVEGESLADGSVMASKIEIEEQEEKEEVEIKGTITSIGADSLVVGGTTVLTSTQTLVRGNDGESLDFSSLQVGQQVEVDGFMQNDGSVLATRIKIEEQEDDDIVLNAPVEDLGTSTMTVLGRTVLIDSSTELRGRRNQPISLSDLKVGVQVKVEGMVLQDGSVRARKIQADVSPRSGQSSQVVTGNISAKGSNFIKVGNRRFTVRASTRIEDASGEPLALSTLTLGTRVRVEFRKSGKSFAATEIKVL